MPSVSFRRPSQYEDHAWKLRSLVGPQQPLNPEAVFRAEPTVKEMCIVRTDNRIGPSMNTSSLAMVDLSRSDGVQYCITFQDSIQR
jgi:hypothetical protein